MPEKQAMDGCHDILYPLVDTLSVAAGVTWVVAADRDQANAEQSHSGGGTDVYRAERIGGYTMIGLFGASAIYGYVVEGLCEARRADRRARQARALPSLTHRVAFPGSVYGFGFSGRPEAALQACSARGGTWRVQGSVGECLPKAGGTDPLVRIGLGLGDSSQIVLVYEAPAADLGKHYGFLYTSVQRIYGDPQVPPGHPSAACTTSLAQCLQDGEHPAGPVWHWADGTIEIAPLWDKERPLLELRYLRDDPQTH